MSEQQHAKSVDSGTQFLCILTYYTIKLSWARFNSAVSCIQVTQC